MCGLCPLRTVNSRALTTILCSLGFPSSGSLSIFTRSLQTVAQMSEVSGHAASHSAAAPQKEARSTKRPGQPKYSKDGRPTHFLCFPLTTDECIPQLGESLAHFRSVTVPLSEPHSSPKSNDYMQPEDTHMAASVVKGGIPTRHEQTLETAQKLRLLPKAAHRPPGTFHLTLGTMNLSQQQDMDKALALLSEIDFPALLKEAESGDPAAKLIKAREDVSSLQPLKSLSRAISPPSTTSSAGAAIRQTQDTSSAPLTIFLYSLGTFPTASSARVFYAVPKDPSDRLQTFGNLVPQTLQRSRPYYGNEATGLTRHSSEHDLREKKGQGCNAGKGWRRQER